VHNDVQVTLNAVFMKHEQLVTPLAQAMSRLQ